VFSKMLQGKTFPKLSLKADAFHQTIVNSEINLKETQEAEEIFLLEQEWSRLLVKYPEDFVAMLAPSGLLLKVSENSKEIVGSRPDQLIGVNITNFIHINELTNFYDQLNLVVNAGRTAILTHQFKTSAGFIELETTLYTFFPRLMGDSRCVMLLSKRLPNMKEINNPDSLSVMNKQPIPIKFISRLTLDGIFTYVSPSITGILGYQPNELLGTSTYEYFHVDELQKLSQVHLTVKASLGEQVSVLHQFKRKDGSFASVETTFNVFLNPVSGNPECILCSTSDMSKSRDSNQKGAGYDQTGIPAEMEEQDKAGLVAKLRAEVHQLRELLLERTSEIERLRQERENSVDDSDKKRRKRKVRTDLQCEQCGTKESPEWRKGPTGNQTLCNACGLRFAKKSRTKKLQSDGRDQSPLSYSYENLGENSSEKLNNSKREKSNPLSPSPLLTSPNIIAANPNPQLATSFQKQLQQLQYQQLQQLHQLQKQLQQQKQEQSPSQQKSSQSSSQIPQLPQLASLSHLPSPAQQSLQQQQQLQQLQQQLLVQYSQSTTNQQQMKIKREPNQKELQKVGKSKQDS